MARLIDADALKERWTIASPEPYNTDAVEVIDSIDDSPTVDAMEVVRCKDCRHWYVPDETCLKIYSDGAVSAYAWQFRNADDFCSYGERKPNEDT